MNKKSNKEFILPVFHVSESLNSLIERLPNVDLQNFSLCHAVTASLIYMAAQIRSRAMTSGINNPQDITRIPSINHIMKIIGNNTYTNLFCNTLGLLHILPYMSKEELKNPSEIFESISTKGGKNKLGHNKDLLFSNYDCRVAEAKGKAKSIIGKLQSIPIYKPTDLLRYSDSTIGMLFNNIWKDSNLTITILNAEILGLFPENLVFHDGFIINNNINNLTPMEGSLNLPITRIMETLTKPEVLNEEEEGLTPLEKISRKSRNKIIKGRNKK